MVTTSTKPLTSYPIRDTEDLIDHLKPMLEKQFSEDITNIYFGDIGVYLPIHFIGPRKENRAVLVLAPAYDRLVEGTRVASQETREIGIDVIGLVNITPYFKASPKEAYGERQLAELMRKLRIFLTQQANVQLGGRVQYLSVNNITWSWLQRDNLSLRGASLEISAFIKVDRKMSN